ncbi:hypothetical protein ACLGGT_20925 [Roseovarius sp. MS2]
MPDLGRATAMFAFTDSSLGQIGIKDINGADERKSGPADIDISPMPYSLRETKRFYLASYGDCWPSIKAR